MLPIYFLQVCYGMNSGFPAIATAQLRENCTEEFPITLTQETWIGMSISISLHRVGNYSMHLCYVLVSLDNFSNIIVCLFSGYLQERYGPKKVRVIRVSLSMHILLWSHYLDLAISILSLFLWLDCCDLRWVSWTFVRFKNSRWHWTCPAYHNSLHSGSVT